MKHAVHGDTCFEKFYFSVQIYAFIKIIQFDFIWYWRFIGHLGITNHSKRNDVTKYHKNKLIEIFGSIYWLMNQFIKFYSM